jgi:Ca2+/Na+ antiporter
MLFYLGLAAVALGLLLASVRRMLLLVLLTTLPLLAFAVKFDGGAVERYLPVYPVLFLAFGWVLAQSQLPRVLKVVPVLFFCVAIFVNSSVMARVVLNRQKQRTSERVQAVVPRLKPNSWLVTTHLQDDLVNFQASFPFEPINRHNTYHIYPLVVPNSDQAPRWREEFAANILKTWEKGGDAWLSVRMLNPRPEPQWNWVEGDDPRVKWNDIYQFFEQFQTSEVGSGADGFMLLEKSEANVQLLNTIVHRRQATIMSVNFVARDNSGFK